jgi:hypothetical protein
MGSSRINAVRQRLALTLTEHVKSKMTDFMKRKPQDRSKQENELFGDMMNENSKSKMMLLTNLESTRDDRVLKPEDRDEEGYITNAWGDTQGTSIKSLDPAESGLDTMNRQQVDYDRQKLLRRSTTNAFSRDEAEKRLNDITEGRAQKSNKPILSTYTQSARIQTARQRLADIFDVIEGGGKIKPTKFKTKGWSKERSTEYKMSPADFLDISDYGWEATDPQTSVNFFAGGDNDQDPNTVNKILGTGEDKRTHPALSPERQKRKEIFRGDELGSVEYIRRQLRRGDTIETPYLDVEKEYDPRDEGELKAEGHEGRHRARALFEEGETEMPVSIFPKGSGMPVKTQQGERHTYRMKPHKSARIQMARERLGAVNNPVTNVINSLRKQKTSPTIQASHFMSPSGEIVGDYTHPDMVKRFGPSIGINPSGLREDYSGFYDGVPQKYVTNNDIHKFMNKTGLVRLTNEGYSGGAGHSISVSAAGKLTSQQMRRLKEAEFESKSGTTINYDIYKESKANEWKALSSGSGYTQFRKDHLQHFGKLRQRIAIGIRVSPTTKRIKRVKKVLDYEYPYQGPEVPTTKHPKTNIPKLTGPRTTTGEQRRRKVTKKERKSLDSYIKDDKKIDPRNAKLRQKIAGLGFRERILNWLKEQPRFKSFDPDSSFVGTVKYDQDNQSMQIELNGKKYDFCNVEERLFDSFSGAGSKGAFFNREIKSLHNCGAW